MTIFFLLVKNYNIALIQYTISNFTKYKLSNPFFMRKFGKKWETIYYFIQWSEFTINEVTQDSKMKRECSRYSVLKMKRITCIPSINFIHNVTTNIKMIDRISIRWMLSC